jgi:hypothetical protein
MTETWTLTSINYYGRNLNIGNFGRKQLLWPELVEETMAVLHVILAKREAHVGVEREIARAQDEKMCKDERTQEKKNFWHTIDICGHFDFSYD